MSAANPLTVVIGYDPNPRFASVHDALIAAGPYLIGSLREFLIEQAATAVLPVPPTTGHDDAAAASSADAARGKVA